MRNLRLDIEYDGTHYHGWQVQKNAPSVAGAIEEALVRVLQHPVRLNGSGRTDAGVHALGQVANFPTERDIPEENLQRALNSLLPRDIVIRRVVEAPAEFNARRDATLRYYRYQCFLGEHPSALYRHLTLYVRRPLDVEAMRRAAGHFVGTHDFSAFRSAHCDANNPVRTVTACEILDERPFLYIDVKSYAFLRSQVRIMVSTLLEVGEGRRPPDDILTILASKDRACAGPTLPAKGLILMEVRYS